MSNNGGKSSSALSNGDSIRGSPTTSPLSKISSTPSNNESFENKSDEQPTSPASKISSSPSPALSTSSNGDSVLGSPQTESSVSFQSDDDADTASSSSSSTPIPAASSGNEPFGNKSDEHDKLPSSSSRCCVNDKDGWNTCIFLVYFAVVVSMILIIIPSIVDLKNKADKDIWNSEMGDILTKLKDENTWKSKIAGEMETLEEDGKWNLEMKGILNILKAGSDGRRSPGRSEDMIEVMNNLGIAFTIAAVLGCGIVWVIRQFCFYPWKILADTKEKEKVEKKRGRLCGEVCGIYMVCVVIIFIPYIIALATIKPTGVEAWETTVAAFGTAFTIGALIAAGIVFFSKKWTSWYENNGRLEDVEDQGIRFI